MEQPAMTDLFGSVSSTLNPSAEHNPYRGSEYMSSLKGLLRPFKGKGDFEKLSRQAIQWSEALCSMMLDLIEQFDQPKFARFNILLKYQLSSPSKRNPSFRLLRWRSKDFNKMGAQVWEAVVRDPKTPDHIVEALMQFEIQRVTLNMQMSQVNMIMAQALECRDKVDSAMKTIGERK